MGFSVNSVISVDLAPATMAHRVEQGTCTCSATWIQAIIERAVSSRQTALLSSVPLLDVISEKALNIVNVAQHVKDNKAEQGLVTKATASTEAFCNSYRHSPRQASWPSNGVKASLYALSGVLGEIEQYLMEQMDKSRATRFFSSPSNASTIKVFVRRLEMIVNRLENIENVTESIALRDPPCDIRLHRLCPDPSPGRTGDSIDHGHGSAVQSRIAPTTSFPVFTSTKEIPTSFANTAMILSQPHENTLLTPLDSLHGYSPSGYSVPMAGMEACSASGSITQALQPPINYDSSLDQMNPTTSILLPDQRGPPPVFPIARPMPWVLVPPYAAPSQLMALGAQTPISQAPPITINISNIGNSNDTTTIE